MLPQHGAVGRRDAGGAIVAEQHDLRDAGKRHELRRAVALAAIRTVPTRLARRGVVPGELAADCNDDEIAHDQRRTCDSPSPESSCPCRPQRSATTRRRRSAR